MYSLINAGVPEADDGLRLMQICMDSCGSLGLASLRLQSVTTAMCASLHVLSGCICECNPLSMRRPLSAPAAIARRPAAV